MAEINWAGLREEALADFTFIALPPSLKLPALPHVVTQFVQKANEPDATLKDLATIVETDSGMTMELLKYVNSSYVGLRNKASSVQQAITLLGLAQTKMFLISSGLQAAVKSKESKLINQASFWSSSFQKALFAKEVAKLLKTDGEVAFAGALLQDYLLPVVTNFLSDDYVKFFEDRDSQPPQMCEFERATFGWDHARASACLAHRWNLPDDIVCCILFHHHGLRLLGHPVIGRSAAAAVALSAMLPDSLQQDTLGLELLVKLQTKWRAFDLGALAEIVDNLQSDLGMGVRVEYSLTHRCRPALEAHANASACVPSAAG